VSGHNEQTWLRALDAALADARRCGDRSGETWVLNSLAHTHHVLGHADEARAGHRQCLAIQHDTDDQSAAAWMLKFGDLLNVLPWPAASRSGRWATEALSGSATG
jgi:hypothetical protein